MPSENALPGRPTSFSIQNSKPQARIQKRFSCRPDAFKPKGNSGITKPNRPTASGQNHEKTHPYPLPNRRCRHIRDRIRRRAHRRIGSPNRRFGTPHRRIGAQRQHGIPPEPFGLRMQRYPLPKKLSKPPTATKDWHAAKSAAPAMPKPRPCSAKTATSAANASIKRLRACSGRLRSVKIQAV